MGFLVARSVIRTRCTLLVLVRPWVRNSARQTRRSCRGSHGRALPESEKVLVAPAKPCLVAGHFECPQVGSVLFVFFCSLFLLSCVVCLVKGSSFGLRYPRPGRSEQTENENSLPQITPTRAYLENNKRLMRREVFIGRGSRQRNLERSKWANDFKVAVDGRTAASSSQRSWRRTSSHGLYFRR